GTEEVEQDRSNHQQEQCDCQCHSSVLLCESTFQKGRLRAPRERTEWIDEVPVDGGELRLRMPHPHHAYDSRFLFLQRIDQDQTAARLEVIMKFGQLLVFAG